jgi:hypothetical protein
MGPHLTISQEIGDSAVPTCTTPFSIFVMLRARQMPMPSRRSLSSDTIFCSEPQLSGTFPSSSALPNWVFYCTISVLLLVFRGISFRSRAAGGEKTTRYPACLPVRTHAHPVTFPHRPLSTSKIYECKFNNSVSSFTGSLKRLPYGEISPSKRILN